MCKGCNTYPKMRRGRDFLKKAKNSDRVREIRRCGKHQVVKTNKKDGKIFSIPVPNHPEPLGKGIRHSLIKRFIQAGILPLVGILIFFIVF